MQVSRSKRARRHRVCHCRGPAHRARCGVAPRAAMPMALAALSGGEQGTHSWATRTSRELLKLSLHVPRVADSPLLRQRLRQCMLQAASGRFNMVIMGASMATGSMNCGGKVACQGERQRPELTWGRRLEVSLRSALGCPVSLHVHAEGGWTSERAAHKLRNVLNEPSFQPDVVLLDASANDAAVSNWGHDVARRQYLLAAVESIVRRLEAQRIPALLVDLASWWGRFPPTCAWRRTPRARLDAWRSADDGARRALNATTSVYAAVADHWRLPYVSLLEASCGDAEQGGGDSIRHWRAGCESLDAAGMGCWMHPGPTSHNAFAALVAHTFAAIASGRTARLLPPTPRSPSTMQPEFEVASFEICTGGAEKTDLGFGCDLERVECKIKQTVSTSAFAPTRNDGWAAFMDRPGKPGWIADASDAPPERAASIAFRIQGSARRGTLFFEFLRSYDRQMGVAAIWLGRYRSHGIVLDGWWRSRSSQVETAIIPLRSLLPASASNCERTGRGCNAVREHELNVQLQPATERAGAAAPQRLGKFKITRVRACENRTADQPPTDRRKSAGKQGTDS